MGGLKGQCCAGCTRSLHIQAAIVYILNTYLNLRMNITALMCCIK